jgi:hypothetical protein
VYLTVACKANILVDEETVLFCNTFKRYLLYGVEEQVQLEQ